MTSIPTHRSGLVSVVMAVYNGEKYLKSQAESILSQTYSNIELIILDDGSQDCSYEIASGLASRDKRIRLYRNTLNLGLVANFLKGISFADGSFVCLADQDDVWRKDKIVVLKELLEKNSENILAYSDLEVCDESLKTLHTSFWRMAHIRPRNGHLGQVSLLKNMAPGCSVMFRKEVRDILSGAFMDTEFMRLNFSSELDSTPLMHDHLAFFVSSVVGRIAYTSEKLVQYRQHSRNAIGAHCDSTLQKERWLKILNHKIQALKHISIPNRKIDIRKLELFSRSFVDGGFFMRLNCLRYYLFLRNDHWKDKVMGFMECIVPGLYRRLRDIDRAQVKAGKI